MRPVVGQPAQKTRGYISNKAKLRFENLEVRLNPATGIGWGDLTTIPASVGNAPAYIQPTTARSVLIDTEQLRTALAQVPTEEAFRNGASGFELALPAPDGTEHRFAISQYDVMAPELAAAFPEIQTFRGTSLDDPSATIVMDITPQGFHAQVRAADGMWYIDPYYHLEDDVHISYYRRDLSREVVSLGPDTNGGNGDSLEDGTAARFGTDDPNTGGCRCGLCMGLYPAQRGSIMGPARDTSSAAARGTTAGRSGTQLRTYRLAIAATGEYTAFHGGTQALGQAAIVTSMVRINQIYESELSVRMTLVANNQQLVYTNGGSDPYSNNNGGAMLGQNQTVVDGAIGTANYDIGHVYSTGGGGVAYLASVGDDSIKAGGVTGSGSPVGDAFWVDYVAHEMGHQFGANHSFNTSTNGNRNGSTAYEPGSGTTIMGYAAITGPNSDTQAYSDPYFNLSSFDEILEHIDGTIPGIGTRTNTGNAVPTVEAGGNFIIPAQTPFQLTATGSDADAGDVVTYMWEQRDLGAANTLSSADNGTSPLFRVYNPSTDPSRIFPRLSDLVNNVDTTMLGEKMPTTNRTAMKFRVTARDGKGGFNTDDMQVRVVATGSAFAVTSPNTTGITWLVGEQRTVTWNVAGTNSGLINTPNVNITLSTDGGLTFPITLASNVANNGSATIVVPNNITSTARIKVQGAGNIFFDISNVNFAIATNPPATNISGKLFEDWDGDGVLDNFDRGIPNQTILFDRDNDGVQDTQTFTSTGGSTNIPDAPNANGGTKTLAVMGLPIVVQDVNVRVTINHSEGANLRVYLTSPSGLKIPIILNRGTGSSSYNNTILDDEATNGLSTGSGTFTGTFKPDAFLGMFDGSNPNGTWSLQAVDITYGATGSITSWALTFPTELTAVTDANGDYQVAGLTAGAYQVRPLLTGYNFVNPATGVQTVNLASGSSSVPNTNFAVGLQNAIYGLVIADANSDGDFDPGEPGLSGVQVYRDNNNSDTFNVGEPTQTSDSMGRYVFTAQPSGAATIRDVLTGLQVQTFPVGGELAVNLPANGTLYNNNFGISVGTAPIITSNGGGAAATIPVDSGMSYVTTVTATDPDGPTTFTYSIVGGLDAGKFTIDSATGVLTFITAPDFSTPTDTNGDNNYLVTVQVSDGLLIDTQDLTVAVQPDINDAPVLDDSNPGQLSPVPQGFAAPNGDTVASIVGATITDPDLGALKGIAVIGLTQTTSGNWQYSIDAGATWTALGSPSSAAARLLRATDMVRFVPNTGFVGRAQISYHAWDQTSGTAGGTANLTGGGATGGATAFSIVDSFASVKVANTLTPVSEDSVKHRGDPTSFLLTDVTDPDLKAKKGIAVVGWTSGGGVWQYGNGKSWKTMPTLSLAQALLLRDKDRVRYLPSANESGYALLEYHAWDQTTGKRATFVDLSSPSSRGGSASVSATSDFIFAQTTSLNDRPLLDAGGNIVLTPVAPTDPDPTGDTVANFLKSQVADADVGAVRGIAITGVGKTLLGSWEYSTDAGSNWTPVPVVSAKSALLLRAEDMVRFFPNGSAGQATFTFKAWDQTEGTFGSSFNNTTLKTSLAYSTATETATIVIGGTATGNNAPGLNTALTPTMTPVLEDVTKAPGDFVSALIALGTAVTDDFGSLKGVAITGLTGTNDGRWEWSLNGKSWKPIVPVSESMALLLRDSDKIRYIPKVNSNVAATVTFRAWDQTQGGAGGRADLTLAGATGGNSAFSAATDVATVNVTPVNDQPILDITTNPVLAPPTNATPPGVTVASFANALISDADPGALRGIAVTKSEAAFGTWEYSLDAGGTWSIFPTFPPLSDAGALLLRSTDLVRLKPFNFGVVGGTASFNFKAWDQSLGTAGFTFPTAGSTAISKNVDTVTMAYLNGNNKPFLNTTPTPIVAHPDGSTVAALVGSTITDPDPTDAQGIAVTSAASSPKKGTWQYSIDGGTTWLAMDKVSAKNARLLRLTDMLRFQAVPGFVGTVKLTYKAWDQTAGTAGGLSPTTSSAFSTAVETALVSVNTAPEFGTV